MNQIKKQKLTTIEVVKHNNHLYNKLEELWQALHQYYNMAQDRPTNSHLLKEVLLYPNAEQSSFFITEFTDAISKCSNLSIPDPDHILQSHLKTLIKNDKCISNIINIANLCIDLSHWLSHFKKSMLIIIPKPNKFMILSKPFDLLFSQ